MNPVEERIRSISDLDIYKSARTAFPAKSDVEIIAELVRAIVFVAISWNDIREDGQDPDAVLDRYVFTECDELAHYFPWPQE